MIDTKYRGKFQILLIEPLLKKPWLQKIDPSVLTLSALFLGLLIPFFLWAHLPLLAFALLAASGFLDTLDGSLARFTEKTSDKGAALDITSDRLVEFAVILGLFLIEPEQRGLLSLLMLGSILFCITTFLVVGIFSQNETEKSFFYSPGIIERTEAFAFFSAMILFPKGFFILSLLFSALVSLTALIRIKQFLMEEKSKTQFFPQEVRPKNTENELG
ncbi:MAG: Inner membrane protein YnjF [Chlamydiae bacterium]|nr:Inner membrane protein YnjF [Chlamydiota bacterium]